MLSVLITTYNRAESLQRTLVSFSEAEPPAGGWEIIVVDNRCSDRTPEVLESFRTRLPLRVVYEAEPGMGPARRTGLRYVLGDLILCTDDDVIADKKLLVRYREAADRETDYDMFGGTVLAAWPSPPPDWATCTARIQGTCFVVTPKELVTGPTIYSTLMGPNFAVRTEVFRNWIERTNWHLGPDGKLDYGMGVETELLRKLDRAGHKAYFLADAVVQHVIRPEQMSRKWALGRAVRLGRGVWRMAAADGERSAKLFGMPRYMIRQAIGTAGEVLVATLRGDRLRAFERRWHLQYQRGVLAEARRLSREARRATP